MQIAVITRVPDPRENAGNLYSPLGELFVQTAQPDSTNGYLGRHEHAPIAAVLSMRCTLFTLGEVLILDSDGREPHGRGRKPDKWDVDVEHFDDLDAAIARSLEVVAQAADIHT